MKYNLREIMRKAWQICKTYHTDFSEALTRAWAWFKLRAKMTSEVVRFHFVKTDGTIREAWGTLRDDIVGEIKGTGRKPNDYLQTYWDVEKDAFRCFKIINLVLE